MRLVWFTADFLKKMNNQEINFINHKAGWRNRRLRLKFVIKKLFKQLIIILPAVTGYPKLKKLFYKKQKRIIILDYHRVADKQNNNYAVKKEEFEKQVLYLLHNYNIVSLMDIVNYIQGKTNLADNSVAITFDDGYAEIYFSVYPILKKHKLPVTIFLVTDYAGTDKEFYWDSYFGLVGNKFLSWLQVKDMSENGISFGIHTATHPNLARLNEEEIKEEISRSKNKLEIMLNKKAEFFSYPFGTVLHINDITKKVISEYGFSCALTTIYGTVGLKSDILNLRRILIDANDNFYIFKQKVNGNLDTLSFLNSKFWQILFLQFNRFMGLEVD
jgi:peptidoglycan/xylan/chitin deacetylase (PgdA/CDA1 family)